MTETIAQERLPRLDVCLLLLLMASFVAIAPWSSVNGDFARDLTIANGIVQGDDLPLRGPILASTFHLGPVWFYLLALAQSLGLGYLGIVVTLAVLGSLQFPLAYLAGKAWFDRSVGLIWASLLIIPSWSTYEQLMPGHTSLTATLLILVIWCAQRCLHGGGTWRFLLLGLAFAASLHAHPTSLIAFPFVLLAWLLGRQAQAQRLRSLAALLFGGCLLFMPYLIDLVITGESPWSSLAAYANSAQGQGSLTQIPALAGTLFHHSLSYWLITIADWPASAAGILSWLWSILVVTGLLASLIALIRKPGRSGVFLVSVLFGLLLLTLMRNFFPFYMLTALKVISLAAVAQGLSVIIRRLRGSVDARWIGPPVLLLYGSVALAAIERQHLGTWPFAFVPLFMTTQAWQAPETLALSNALAARQGGRWLCRYPKTALHGSWAQMQVISFGIERGLACRQGPQIIGGAASDRDHWAGFSIALLRDAGLEATSRAGNFGLVPVSRVINDPPAILAPDDLAFPPKPPLPVPTDDTQTLTWSLDGPGDFLAVSNLAFGIAPRPVVRLTCGSRAIAPSAEDASSSIYDLASCEQGRALSIETNAADYVDIIMIDSETAGERPLP